MEPVDEATAAPRIAQFLYNQRSSDAIAKELKQVRKQAKIEYVGEFAADLSAADAMAKAKADAAAKARDQAKAEAQSEANARAEALSKARAEAEAVARREAAAKRAPSKSVQVPSQSVEKGLRGL
jgi:colicin import membrane protein